MEAGYGLGVADLSSKALLAEIRLNDPKRATNKALARLLYRIRVRLTKPAIEEAVQEFRKMLQTEKVHTRLEFKPAGEIAKLIQEQVRRETNAYLVGLNLSYFRMYPWWITGASRFYPGLFAHTHAPIPLEYLSGLESIVLNETELLRRLESFGEDSYL